MPHYPPNWQNGMKVSQKHLSDSEAALREELYQSSAAQHTSYTYGLLPEPQGGEGVDLWCKLENTGAYRIGLSKCHAITRGGCRVSIHDYASHLSLSQSESQIRAQLEQAGGKLLVILTVLPFAPEAFGEPDPEESPLRLPWLRPTYRLELMRQDQLHLSAYQVPVGRLVSTAQGASIDPEYTPPCSAVASLSSLRERYDRYRKALEYITDGCQQTILRAEQLSPTPAQPKGDEIIIIDPGTRPSVVSSPGTPVNVKWIAWRLSGLLMESISEKKPSIDNILVEQAPIYTLNAYQQLAAKMAANLKALSRIERAHWINFIKELHSVENPLDTLQELSTYTYDHVQVQEAFAMIEKFLRLLLKLYNHYEGLPASSFAWQKVDVTIGEVPPQPQRQDIL